jgi:hypothetical protein
MMSKCWVSVVALLLTAVPGWAGEATGLTLIDAGTDRPVRLLTDGDVVDLTTTTRGINVRADVEGDVGSVRFGLNDNDNYRTENVAPYALAGDNQGNYSEWVPAPGAYTVTATPYAESGAQGAAGQPMRVTFTVQGTPKASSAVAQPSAREYPDIESDAELGPVAAPIGGTGRVGGELKRWHCVTVSFEGPESSETASPNPFLHYRLDVTFTHEYVTLVVPGYYAGDGKGGPEGNVWKVRFAPLAPGPWSYFASFRAGYNVNVSLDPDAGQPTACDGATGCFEIAQSDKTSADFRAPENGQLGNFGCHYLTFRSSGRAWIKGGPDIPENFLGYVGFENTPNARHTYSAHIDDWRPGDPDWGNGQGRGIIGALNYIAEMGGNCVYFLPMNIGGDGKDTFPTIGPYEKTRYDSSKLRQWEIVFTHAQTRGIFLHFQLAETEDGNEKYHDNGELGPERKLFYRELVARFGHHNGMQFNIGEENDYGTERRIEFARFIKAVDPYDHPVAVHTHSGKERQTYDPLLEKLAAGEEIGIDMTSFQGGRSRKEMAELMAYFREASAEVGHPWVMSYDEPQSIHNDRDDEEKGYPMARRHKMWPAYMGGAGGFEWYVQKDGGGHSLDQAIDDFSQMDVALLWSGYARDFLYKLGSLRHVEPAHDLADAARGETYVLARSGLAYAIYNDSCGEGFTIDLSAVSGFFAVRWFDPRHGGPLQDSNVTTVTGGGIRSLGHAPRDLDQDWACLLSARR